LGRPLYRGDGREVGDAGRNDHPEAVLGHLQHALGGAELGVAELQALVSRDGGRQLLLQPVEADLLGSDDRFRPRHSKERDNDHSNGQHGDSSGPPPTGALGEVLRGE
jgi:hypothetical protein